MVLQIKQREFLTGIIILNVEKNQGAAGNFIDNFLFHGAKLPFSALKELVPVVLDCHGLLQHLADELGI